MPVPSRISPVTGSDVASKEWYIHSDDSTGWFRDVHGRNLLLRGINLASSAKTPVGQPAQQLQGFWESAESGDVSFVNRVLDLDVDSDGEHSADSHLKRLKSWGFNCLRYVTTWESIEHKGPYVLADDGKSIQRLIILLTGDSMTKSTSSTPYECSGNAKNTDSACTWIPIRIW